MFFQCIFTPQESQRIFPILIHFSTTIKHQKHKSYQRCVTRPPPTVLTTLKPATGRGEKIKVLEKSWNKKARDNPAAQFHLAL